MAPASPAGAAGAGPATGARGPLGRAVGRLQSHCLAGAVLAFLVLLTLLALSPWNPLGPFDARDFAPLPGLRLDYPAWGALIEPLAAPGLALMGSPDYQVAIVSTLAWAVLGTALVAGVRQLGRLRQRPVASLLKVLGYSAGAGGLVLVYVGFIVLVQLPGWRLVVADPDWVVTDLHSHGTTSRDSLVFTRTNLDWHAQRGYGVVAVTEHDEPAFPLSPEQARENARRHLPAFIPGVEYNTIGHKSLLALNVSRAQPYYTYSWKLEPRFAQLMTRRVHEQDGGAVIALSWRIDAPQVHELVQAGVDGFEIANQAHPDVAPATRAAILAEARAHGLLLVSSTDWHGYGGLARAWTLVRVPGQADMTNAQRRAAVVTLLHNREAGAVLPVVAGYLGPPSTLRAVFAPFVEAARYAAELSPLRVLAWWLYGAALIVLAEWMRRRGFRRRLLVAGLLGLLGAAVALRGWELVAQWSAVEPPKPFAVYIGQTAGVTGLVALVVALAVAAAELYRRARLRRSR